MRRQHAGAALQDEIEKSWQSTSSRWACELAQSTVLDRALNEILGRRGPQGLLVPVLTEAFKDFNLRLSSCGAFFDVDGKAKRLAELEHAMAEGNCGRIPEKDGAGR